VCPSFTCRSSPITASFSNLPLPHQASSVGGKKSLPARRGHTPFDLVATNQPPFMPLTYRPFDHMPKFEELRHELRTNVSDTERAVSALSGLGLLVAGLSRGGASKWVLAAAGLALMQRGFTGHCHLYEQMEVN